MPRSKCPECHHTTLKHSRKIWRVCLGIVFIVVGVLGALPSLGITMPLLLLGIFMTTPRTMCTECSWSERYRPSSK